MNSSEHRRRNRGGWGGGGGPVKNVGGGREYSSAPPPAFMAENPLFCEFLMIYFHYDFSLSLSFSFLYFFILISYRPCCDFHPIFFSLQICCGNNGARHKLYARSLAIIYFQLGIIVKKRPCY